MPNRDDIQSPQDIPLKPLTKGMFRDRPASSIETGGFYDLPDYLVTERGIQNRPGYARYAELSQVANPPIKDLVSLWFSSGLKETILFDSNGVYKAASTGYTEIGTDLISISETNNIDYATFSDQLFFTDDVSNPQYYNGTTNGTVNSDWICKTMTYHRDRLWIGNITDDSGGIDDGNSYKQMIRWSPVGPGDTTTFENFINLPYTGDELLRIEPLEDLLIAYFENSVWVGRPTSRAGNEEPYAFKPIPNNNVGLVGMKAVTQFTDAHFFIGQDDIYILQINGSLQKTNCPVFDDFIQGNVSLSNAYVSVDQANKAIVFGIPDSSGVNFERIIRYNYLMNAWSYDTYQGTFLSNVNVFTGVTIDELTGTIEDLSGTIDSLSGSAAGISLWSGKDGYLVNLDPIALVDDGSDVISSVFETGDFDLGELNYRKSISKLSIKLRNNYTQGTSDNSAVKITISSSIDKGSSWRELGEIFINEGWNEYKLSFQVTGDIIRFKGVLDSSQSTNSYTIEEIVLRGKSRGIQSNP